MGLYKKKQSVILKNVHAQPEASRSNLKIVGWMRMEQKMLADEVFEDSIHFIVPVDSQIRCFFKDLMFFRQRRL